jgi:hypothetical protein
MARDPRRDRWLVHIGSLALAAIAVMSMLFGLGRGGSVLEGFATAMIASAVLTAFVLYAVMTTLAVAFARRPLHAVAVHLLALLVVSSIFFTPRRSSKAAAPAAPVVPLGDAVVIDRWRTERETGLIRLHLEGSAAASVELSYGELRLVYESGGEQEVVWLDEGPAPTRLTSGSWARDTVWRLPRVHLGKNVGRAPTHGRLVVFVPQGTITYDTDVRGETRSEGKLERALSSPARL